MCQTIVVIQPKKTPITKEFKWKWVVIIEQVMIYQLNQPIR